MAEATIDRNKYVSIGLHPNDHEGLSDEDIKALDEKLAMTPEQRQQELIQLCEDALKS